MAVTNWQLLKFVVRHPFVFWPGFLASVPSPVRRLTIFLLVMGVLSVAGFGYYVYASNGLPLWKRLFPWVLVYEYLAKDGLTAFEKYQLTTVVMLSAVIIILVKQHSTLLFSVGESLFGLFGAWHIMSFEMTSSRPLNIFLLIGASWVVAAGLEGIYRYIGVWQEPKDQLPPSQET
jgi:hypothetical protein